MGVFYFLQKQLRFALQDRLGLLLVAVAILGSWGLFFYKPKVSKTLLDLNSAQVKAINRKLDSLDSIDTSKSQLVMYPFNPNFISDYKGYQLGMSIAEIDRLHEFRAQDKWINSTSDFKRVTQVSDSLLSQISPYFKFPEWVTNKKPAAKTYDYKYKGPKKDLNLATAQDLQAVFGIGPTLSKRIIEMRERFQGYSDTIQLGAVYGLSDAVKSGLWERFELKSPKLIEKIKFTKASASDMASIPGISFELAHKIVTFRRLRDSVVLPSELLKIDGLSQQKLELITLYLQFN